MSNYAGYTVLFRKLARVNKIFYRNWDEYKNGFGNLTDNYWMGLEKMYQITNRKGYNLFIELGTNSSFSNITHRNFFIYSENYYYKLNLGTKISGTLYDNSVYHHGLNFTTFDQDHDARNNSNCAIVTKGGWWFSNCYSMCLTCEHTAGQYQPFSGATNENLTWSDNLKMSIIPAIL